MVDKGKVIWEPGERTRRNMLRALRWMRCRGFRAHDQAVNPPSNYTAVLQMAYSGLRAAQWSPDDPAYLDWLDCLIVGGVPQGATDEELEQMVAKLLDGSYISLILPVEE